MSSSAPPPGRRSLMGARERLCVVRLCVVRLCVVHLCVVRSDDPLNRSVRLH